MGPITRLTKYLDNVFSHGFVPMITKPTRVTQSSATLIDHIYSNNIEYSSSSGVIITDIADHFGIFHSISGKNQPDRTRYNFTLSFSNANLTKFKTYLLNHCAEAK